MVRPTFWLRWAWRDLRSRKVQVLAIAGIIALGSGIYAGLGSTSVWRKVSLDASFAATEAHDVRVAGTAGLTTSPERLVDAVRSVAGPAVVAEDVRLVADLPMRAGVGGRIAASGELVGVDLATRRIDRWQVTAGRELRTDDDDVVLLDDHFARAHALAATGTIEVAGTRVRYVGTALHPEYLNTNVTFGATIQGAATRAVVYGPVTLVQRLAGREGQVNGVVLRLRAGADASTVAAGLSAALPERIPELPVVVTARVEDPSVRALYDEVTSEQRIFDVFALLILAGAGFATFNLARRVVESQRRDIGIAMALGVPPRLIAIRPVVMGAQIAVGGVLLGALTGWALGTWVVTIIRGQLPLPVWQTPWQSLLFLRSAALGLSIPLAGTAYPVWRAVRVAPTDALLAPHLRSRRRRAGTLLRRLTPPGGTLARAPWRRITVAPARSLMTVAGVGLILAPLFAALGITDSTTATIEGASGSGPDRLLVHLAGYAPVTAPVVTDITGSSSVAEAAVGLDTGGYLERNGRSIGVSISMADLDDPLAVPPGVADRRVAPGGIVISAKAASDLGLVEGDPVRLRHPVRQGVGYRFTTTTLPVRAVVDLPYRFVAYLSIEDDTLLGLDGIVNTVTVRPRAGVSMDRLQRAVAAEPGVAWALSARAVGDTIRQVLSLVGDLFAVLQVVIGLLAFLVAYNSAKVGTDERARENATMMAFGIPVRRVVTVAVVESGLLGLAAVGVGLGVGRGLFEWILRTVLPAAVPDLAVLADIGIGAYLVTVGIGLAAMVTAPMMVARQLRRTDLPSTLRYVE